MRPKSMPSAKTILPKRGPEREALLMQFYEKARAENLVYRAAELKYGLPANSLESFATARDLPYTGNRKQRL